MGSWNGVVDASSVPASVSLAISSFTPILALLALLASAIAVVLVYNVIALTLEERRREHAIVAAVGAPPSVLIIGPLLEAGVLGAVGGLLGALGGIALARPIVGTLSHLTVNLAGVPISVHTTSSTYIAGLVVGAVIGMLAAARPIQKAMRADVAAEISGRDQRERTSNAATVRRGVLYTALAVVGVFISWLGDRNGSLQQWQPDAAILGFLIGAVFATLASGVWAPVSVRGILRTGRFKRGVTRLGLANLVREPGRTAVMAIAIGAAVGVAFITSSYNKAIDQDIATGQVQSHQARSVLVSTYASAGGYNTDGQIPLSVTTALARIPGVTRVDAFNGELSGHAVGQLTLVESETYPTFNVDIYEGTATARRFARGEVLVGANLARRDHLHPGSLLHLDTPSGVASVKVQGIWNDGNAAGDNVYLSQSLQHRLFGSQLPSQAELEVESDGVTRPRHRLGPRRPSGVLPKVRNPIGGAQDIRQWRLRTAGSLPSAAEGSSPGVVHQRAGHPVVGGDSAATRVRALGGGGHDASRALPHGADRSVGGQRGGLGPGLRPRPVAALCPAQCHSAPRRLPRHLLTGLPLVGDVRAGRHCGGAPGRTVARSRGGPHAHIGRTQVRVAP